MRISPSPAETLGGPPPGLRLRADLWVSAFYWPPYAPQLTAREYRAYVSHASERGVLPLRVAQERVEEAVREVRPFHWELEFPEEFFDSDGARRADAGFDAILGNPPWEGIGFKAAEFYTRFEPVFAFATTKMEKQTLADAVLSTVTARKHSRERTPGSWKTPAEALNKHLLLVHQGIVATTP